jgi:hypothetical protein
MADLDANPQSALQVQAALADSFDDPGSFAKAYKKHGGGGGGADGGGGGRSPRSAVAYVPFVIRQGRDTPVFTNRVDGSVLGFHADHSREVRGTAGWGAYGG